LSEYQWQNLPPVSTLGDKSWPVTLTDSNGLKHWQGFVGRVENHFDNTSRQRALVVIVERPLALATPLLPGTFVEALIQGRSLSNMWQLPASAVSQSSDIWIVNADNKLNSHKANKVFEKGEWIYLQPLLSQSSANVVVRPLNSYVSGTFVTPKTETLIGSSLYSQNIETLEEIAKSHSEVNR